MSELNPMTASDDEIMATIDPSKYIESMATDPVDKDPAEVVDEPAEETEEEESNTEEASEESTESNETTETEETESDVTDAAKQLEALFAPLSAIGKEIKIDNIEDARRLMQMGAGFNKKMAALKPHLKLVKMLQNNGLLDEGKLAHLIDVSKKNPNAIGKLLADSDIDPLNLDPSNEYTPNSYTVSDTELELDNVLDDLKESPHYAQLLDIAVNKWDAPSKQLLLSQPEIISTLHEQIASGIYQQVTAVMERERLLGRLNGLSDLVAYKQVGDMMDAKGMFKQAAKQTEATPQATGKVEVDESKLKSRKLAASPTKSSPAIKKSLADFDPLKMSDEEIMSMSLDKFL